MLKIITIILGCIFIITLALVSEFFGDKKLNFTGFIEKITPNHTASIILQYIIILAFGVVVIFIGYEVNNIIGLVKV